MKQASFKTNKVLCADCSLALRRFIGGLDGVDSIDVEQGNIVVSFDEEKIEQDKLLAIAMESVRRLGYDPER